MDIFKKLGT